MTFDPMTWEPTIGSVYKLRTPFYYRVEGIKHESHLSEIGVDTVRVTSGPDDDGDYVISAADGSYHGDVVSVDCFIPVEIDYPPSTINPVNVKSFTSEVNMNPIVVGNIYSLKLPYFFKCAGNTHESGMSQRGIDRVRVVDGPDHDGDYEIAVVDDRDSFNTSNVSPEYFILPTESVTPVRPGDIKVDGIYEMKMPYHFNNGSTGVDTSVNESMLSQKGIARVRVVETDRSDGVIGIVAANPEDNDVLDQQGLARPEFFLRVVTEVSTTAETPTDTFTPKVGQTYNLRHPFCFGERRVESSLSENNIKRVKVLDGPDYEGDYSVEPADAGDREEHPFGYVALEYFIDPATEKENDDVTTVNIEEGKLYELRHPYHFSNVGWDGVDSADNESSFSEAGITVVRVSPGRRSSGEVGIETPTGERVDGSLGGLVRREFFIREITPSEWRVGDKVRFKSESPTRDDLHGATGTITQIRPSDYATFTWISIKNDPGFITNEYTTSGEWVANPGQLEFVSRPSVTQPTSEIKVGDQVTITAFPGDQTWMQQHIGKTAKVTEIDNLPSGFGYVARVDVVTEDEGSYEVYVSGCTPLPQWEIDLMNEEKPVIETTNLKTAAEIQEEFDTFRRNLAEALRQQAEERKFCTDIDDFCDALGLKEYYPPASEVTITIKVTGDTARRLVDEVPKLDGYRSELDVLSFFENETVEHDDVSFQTYEVNQRRLDSIAYGGKSQS